MPPFKSEYAVVLLKAHKPNEWAYLCKEVGLEPDEKNVKLIDHGYSELSLRGFVIQDPDQKFAIYQGCVPRHMFQITDAGLAARGPVKK